MLRIMIVWTSNRILLSCEPLHLSSFAAIGSFETDTHYKMFVNRCLNYLHISVCNLELLAGTLAAIVDSPGPDF